VVTKKKNSNRKPTYNKSSKLQFANVVVSITTALFMLGLCGLLVMQTYQLGRLIKENLEVQVFLKKDITAEQKQQVKKQLAAKGFVAKNDQQQPAITFLSKEAAAQQLTEKVEENFQELLEDNPLHDAFLLKIKPELYEKASLKKIRTTIEAMPAVYEVSIVENMIKEINDNIAKISLFFLVFGGFIILTVFMLIDHIIKISLFARRLIIRSMQLVGATDGFIRKPFIKQFAIQGGMSGVLASLFLWAFLQYLQLHIKELASLYSISHFVVLSVVLVGLGVLVGVWSTYRATNKYLRMPLDALY
jgi:cell division transport system permease protein